MFTMSVPDKQLLKCTRMDDVTVQTLFNSKNRISFCWKYFGPLVVTYEENKKKVVHDEHVYCLPCLERMRQVTDGNEFVASIKVKSYNKSCSTSNMTKHLREEHHLIETVGEKIKKEILKRDNTTVKNNRPAKIPRRSDHKELVVWLCRSLIPFEYITDELIKDFDLKYGVKYLEEDVPTHEMLSNDVLNRVYSDFLLNIKQKINTEAPHNVALTFDIWTDQLRGWNYVTFYLHYLTADFEPIRLTLTTNKYTNESSHEDFKEHINSIKQEFNLTNNTIHLVSDTFIKQVYLDHHYCYGQGFYNLLTDAIKTVPELQILIRKCKEIVKILVQNIPALDKEVKVIQKSFLDSLHYFIESIEFDEKNTFRKNVVKMEQSGGVNEETVISRWHVMLSLLDTLTQFKSRVINGLLNKINQDINISLREYNLMKNLQKFLKKFEEAIQLITTQKSCNLNVALLFRTEVIDVLSSIEDTEDEAYVISQHMLQNINERLPLSKVVVAAALIDSRFSNLKVIDEFLDSLNVDRNTFLSQYIKEVLNIKATIKTEVETDDSLINKLSLKHQASRDKVDPIEEECKRYLASSFNTKSGILKFWNKNKNNFPWVSSLAKELLCIPAMGGACERMFSNSEIEFAKKRSILNPRYLSKILFIHGNYKEMDTDI